MTARHSSRWLFGTLLLAALNLAFPGAQTSVDTAFERFWKAKNPSEAMQAAAVVVESGVGLDEALERLTRGRTYAGDVPRGVVQRSRRTDTVEFPYTIEVPEDYDPARRYQVRVQLHGGVSRPTAAIRGSGSIGSLAGAEQIYLMPIAWNNAPWWSSLQVDNLNAILDDLKRTYNVDENRVVLSGVSDGATAAYYFAMRDTMPFASFLPLNGSIAVLRNRTLGLQEDLFPNNLLNKPFFVINGAQDRLYPADQVARDIAHLQKGGVKMTYLPRQDGEHNTAWWPEVRDTFEAFVAEHPRDPLPATLTWTTAADGTSTPRAHWLIVERLAPPEPEPLLPDVNISGQLLVPNFGVRSSGMQVIEVTRFSNAERFGLRAGDVVQAINGRSIPRGVDLIEILSVNEFDSELTLSVARGNETLELREVFQPTTTVALRKVFPSDRPAGRVDLIREGNAVHARTHAVSAFTLLLSPEAFDFSEPVIVEVNGRPVFEDRVTSSVATLMKWAARDNDRTMLFPAELRIEVP